MHTNTQFLLSSKDWNVWKQGKTAYKKIPTILSGFKKVVLSGLFRRNARLPKYYLYGGQASGRTTLWFSSTQKRA